MIRFADGEFEVALMTYRRPVYVSGWLSRCLGPAADRNMMVSVYDSSPDRETEHVVREASEGLSYPVEYHRVEPETIIGYKPMLAILGTRARYLWVAGDSRYHDFSELDERVLGHLISGENEYVVINTGNNAQMPDTTFSDRDELIEAAFIPSTCIGLSFYDMSLFDQVRTGGPMRIECDRLFRNNYGFAWMGYFWTAFSEFGHAGRVANVGTYDVLPGPKRQAWARRFYGCWADDLLELVDGLPDSYACKETIPRMTWETMRLHSAHYSRLARRFGDLDRETYRRLSESGDLARLTEQTARIRFFAEAPLPAVEAAFIASRGLSKARRIGSGILKKVKRLKADEDKGEL